MDSSKIFFKWSILILILRTSGPRKTAEKIHRELLKAPETITLSSERFGQVISFIECLHMLLPN